MTPEQLAAEKIHESLFGDTFTPYGGEETAAIIQTHAIKPAVDEATMELKEALSKCLPYLKEDLKKHQESLKGADPESQFYGEDIVTPQLISRIEKLLEK